MEDAILFTARASLLFFMIVVGMCAVAMSDGEPLAAAPRQATTCQNCHRPMFPPECAVCGWNDGTIPRPVYVMESEPVIVTDDDSDDDDTGLYCPAEEQS